MKKKLSLIIVSALLLTFSGCSEGGGAQATTTTTAKSATTTESTTATTTENITSTTSPKIHETTTFPVAATTTDNVTVTAVAHTSDNSLESTDNKVSVYCEDEATVDTGTVRITINNDSDKAAEIGRELTLERLNKGSWVKQKLKNTETGTQTVEGGEKATLELTSDMLSEPLKMGYYRVVTTVNGQKQQCEFFVNGDPTPLAEEDILVYTDSDIQITTDTKSIQLRYQYVGDADYAEYGFGCDFSLEKWVDGEWTRVEFSDNAAFIALGYCIGTESPLQSTDVSLDDAFYKEPLTAGDYRVVKTVESYTYYVTFQMVDFSAIPDSPDGYEIYSGADTMTLVIDEIKDGVFVCSLPWPYPAKYNVVLGDLNVGEKFCVGDTIEVGFPYMYQISEWEFQIIALSIDTSGFELDETAAYKPVIYLYPPETTEVDVKLYYNGELTVTYPEYDESKSGWTVTAEPDGTLWLDGNEYSYLFWEGKGKADYDFSEGFCVKGGDTTEFLREKLALLGLTPKEYNEFIVYWLPLMQDNEYNIISFQTDRYTENAVLDVSPKPDSVLRVFMTFKTADAYTEIPPQTLTPTVRTGFTVVEWGGTRVFR